MEVLVDTQALLWYMTGDPQLSKTARMLLGDRSLDRYLSMASLWEIAIKYSIGKLVLMEPYETLIPALLKANEIKVLDITLDHMTTVAKLSFPDPAHKDPFDRLLIAQSRVEEIPILSIDGRFDQYGVVRLW